MTDLGALAIAAGLILAALLPALLTRWHRPGFLMTVQKVTNTNQPETVTIQTNLPAAAIPADLWMAAEKAGLAAQARMQSINDEVMAVMREESDQIAARRAERDREQEALKAARRAKKGVRSLGRPFEAPAGVAPPDGTSAA